MSQTDPIADFLTRLRNANRARHKKVTMPSTQIRREIARVLLENRFIRGYAEVPSRPQNQLQIQMRYTPGQDGVITNIRRISRPGLRRYMGCEELRLGLREMGMVIVSTSRGVMSDGDAVAQGIGGEVLCRVW
jgi:small subunit ribosomal protein S8